MTLTSTPTATVSSSAVRTRVRVVTPLMVRRNTQNAAVSLPVIWNALSGDTVDAAEAISIAASNTSHGSVSGVSQRGTLCDQMSVRLKETHASTIAASRLLTD